MTVTAKLVPAVRTPATMLGYARAAVARWHLVAEPGSSPRPEKRAVAVLWAQYWAETSDRYCYGYNIGNVKWWDGCPRDYHCLKGTWEGANLPAAEHLIANKHATIDGNPSHHLQIGVPLEHASKVALGPHDTLDYVKQLVEHGAKISHIAVVFEPPHPATRFQAFGSLEEAMGEHLLLLKLKRFSVAWPFVLGGDVDAFCLALSRRGYFTAAPQAYARTMRPAFDAFMASDSFSKALADLTPTERELPEEDEPAPDTLPDPSTVRGRQEALALLGFDPGPIDGIDGPKTRAATEAYAEARGITLDRVADRLRSDLEPSPPRDGLDALHPTRDEG